MHSAILARLQGRLCLPPLDQWVFPSLYRLVVSVGTTTVFFAIDIDARGSHLRTSRGVKPGALDVEHRCVFGIVDDVGHLVVSAKFDALLQFAGGFVVAVVDAQRASGVLVKLHHFQLAVVEPLVVSDDVVFAVLDLDATQREARQTTCVALARVGAEEALHSDFIAIVIVDESDAVVAVFPVLAQLGAVLAEGDQALAARADRGGLAWLVGARVVVGHLVRAKRTRLQPVDRGTVLGKMAGIEVGLGARRRVFEADVSGAVRTIERLADELTLEVAHLALADLAQRAVESEAVLPGLVVLQIVLVELAFFGELAFGAQVAFGLDAQTALGEDTLTVQTAAALTFGGRVEGALIGAPIFADIPEVHFLRVAIGQLDDVVGAAVRVVGAQPAQLLFVSRWQEQLRSRHPGDEIDIGAGIEESSQACGGKTDYGYQCSGGCDDMLLLHGHLLSIEVA